MALFGLNSGIREKRTNHVFLYQGVDAEYVSLESVIEPSYVVKNGLNQDFYDYLAGQLAKKLKACGSRVPVITGRPFFSLQQLIVRIWY